MESVASVFIETTIPSYLCARPSPWPLIRAHQLLTKRWWREIGPRVHLYTSPLVIEEAQTGDATQAEKRVRLLSEIQSLAINDEVVAMGQELIEAYILPRKAAVDALHVAVAAYYGVRYLLTWNCKHIANPFLQEQIASCFAAYRVYLPVICTPEHFLANEYTDST